MTRLYEWTLANGHLCGFSSVDTLAQGDLSQPSTRAGRQSHARGRGCRHCNIVVVIRLTFCWGELGGQSKKFGKKIRGYSSQCVDL